MSGRPAVIRQREAKQIMGAAKKAGAKQVEFWIRDVRVVVPLSPDKERADDKPDTNEWLADDTPAA